MDVSAEANVGRVVGAGESYRGKQAPTYTPGISAESVGARALWLPRRARRGPRPDLGRPSSRPDLSVAQPISWNWNSRC